MRFDLIQRVSRDPTCEMFESMLMAVLNVTLRGPFVNRIFYHLPVNQHPWLRWSVPIGLFLLFNSAVMLFLRPVYHSPDGVGYFSLLWSIFSERTLSFASVYQRYNMIMPLTRTSQGWLANNWSFGTALLWVPILKAGQVGRYFFGDSGALAMREALCLANFGSMTFGASCLLLLYSALGSIGVQKNRLLIVFLTLAGTPLFYYSFIDTTYAHAATAFASGLFIWYWLKTSRDSSPLRWGTLGLLAGVAACVRTQEILIVLAPAWEWLWWYKKEPGRRSDLWRSAAAMAGGFAIGFSPQALVWKLLYGSFFAAPASFNLAWSNFAIVPTLFSSYHGLLTWTPLYVIALAGLIWEGAAGDARAWVLAALIAGQILINSFSIAWWGGLAFGLRQMTGTSLIAGLGVGCFLLRCHQTATPWRKIGVLLAGVCSFWTALLALRGYGGTLDMLFYVAPRDLAAVASGWREALQALGAVLKNRSSMPFDLFGLWGMAEAAAGVWLWRLLRGGEKTASWFSSTRWLVVTLLALVLYADVGIYRARWGARPEFTPGTYLDDSQLGNFFKYESYAVKALYHDRRGETVAAQTYFALAEATLPVSPATEPWRQMLQRWRSGVKGGPEGH
jgi:hypothetical protein